MTNEPKFTKGDWKLVKARGIFPFRIISTIPDQGKKEICRIHAMDEANAHLVSSSSALYAALEAIVEGWNETNSEITNRLLTQARSALAKAVGKEDGK